MVRRWHNPVAAMQKRLPHKAFMNREDPLLRANSEELAEMCQRIADGSEHMVYSGSRGEENGCKVVCFDTAEKARAMQTWIDASGIASRRGQSRRQPIRNSKSAETSRRCALHQGRSHDRSVPSHA